MLSNKNFYMSIKSSFFLGLNGLFDFDLTFLSEALLFLILSIVVTNFFLLPISDQIEKRNAYISYNIKKMDIIISLAYERIQESIEIIFKEIEELNRQTKLVSNYSKMKFEQKIKEIEKENQNLIIKAKASLISQSAENFKNLSMNANDLAESFFKEKFNFE